VGEHWDGESARMNATRLALVAAGLAAFDDDDTVQQQATGSARIRASAPTPTQWGTAARADAIDRWPR
jgi:hypothetical protein